MYKLSIKSFFIATTLVVGMNTMTAQDGLVNSLKVNASAKSAESFKFTDVINLENTSIKKSGIIRNLLELCYKFLFGI